MIAGQLPAPAGINPVSLAVAEAIQTSGLAKAELARRMKVPDSAVSRLVRPRYAGHKVRSLVRVAEALGMRLELHFVTDPGAALELEPARRRLARVRALADPAEAARLVAELFAGRPTGAALRVAEVAAYFGVSGGAARRTLKGLAALGLVRRDPGHAQRWLLSDEEAARPPEG